MHRCTTSDATTWVSVFFLMKCSVRWLSIVCGDCVQLIVYRKFVYRKSLGYKSNILRRKIRLTQFDPKLLFCPYILIFSITHGAWYGQTLRIRCDFVCQDNVLYDHLNADCQPTAKINRFCLRNLTRISNIYTDDVISAGAKNICMYLGIISTSIWCSFESAIYH